MLPLTGRSKTQTQASLTLELCPTPSDLIAGKAASELKSTRIGRGKHQKKEGKKREKSFLILRRVTSTFRSQ